MRLAMGVRVFEFLDSVIDNDASEDYWLLKMAVTPGKDE